MGLIKNWLRKFIYGGDKEYTRPVDLPPSIPFGPNDPRAKEACLKLTAQTGRPVTALMDDNGYWVIETDDDKSKADSQ